MAGDGVRLKNAGFKVPKPLIEVNGKPMFINSANCMPDADMWIFIIKNKILKNYNIEFLINKNFPFYKIITVDETTKGQASSCYLAKKFINNNDEIFINSCDSFIRYNSKEFENKKLINDAIVFSTIAKKIHKDNPNSYGWVKKNEIDKISLSCKRPFNVSFNEQRPIVGSFFYKKGKDFINALEGIFKKKLMINNEYYLDMAIFESINLGLKISEIKTLKYIDWGNHKNLK